MFHESCFSRAVLPDDGDEFPRADPQGYPVKSEAFTILVGQIPDLDDGGVAGSRLHGKGEIRVLLYGKGGEILLCGLMSCDPPAFDEQYRIGDFRHLLRLLLDDDDRLSLPFEFFKDGDDGSRRLEIQFGGGFVKDETQGSRSKGGR